jgi:hypothetical protein
MHSIKRHPAAFATLLVVLLIGAAIGWMFWQLQLAKDRRAFSEMLRRENKADLVASIATDANLDWLRRRIGDVSVGYIVRYSAMTDEDRRQVQRLFPEASVVWSGGQPELSKSLQRTAIQPAAAKPKLAFSPAAAANPP